MPKLLKESDYIVQKAPQKLVDDFKELTHGLGGFIAGGAIRNYFELEFWNERTVDPVFNYGFSDPALTGGDEESIWNTPQKVLSYAFDYVYKDIDVFFRNAEDYNDFISYMDTKSEQQYNTSNSIGYNFTDKDYYNSHTLDCVKRKFGTPYEIISNFDFIVAQAAVFESVDEDGYETGEIYLIHHPDFIDHVKNKKLVLSSTPSHRIIMERTYRYLSYGYIPTPDSVKTIVQNFLNDYPELSSITVDDFVQAFENIDVTHIDREDANDNSDEAKKNEQKTKKMLSSSQLMILNNLVNDKKGNDDDRRLQKALGNFILQDVSSIEVSPDSLVGHTSIERHFVRSIKNNVYLDESVRQDKKKHYDKTIKELGLPSNLIFKKNVSYEIVELHKFFINHRHVLDPETIYSLIDFAHSFAVGEAEGHRFFYCRACNRNHHKPDELFDTIKWKTVNNNNSNNIVEESIDASNVAILEKGKSYEHMTNYEMSYKNSDDWAEILHKTFLKNSDNDEWVSDVAQFFVELMDDKKEFYIPSLSEFHDTLDSDSFDPKIPVFLMMNLMKDDNLF